MTRKTYSQGFAHAVLIIGLIIALIVALGFVFWQNFIYKESTIMDTQTQTVREKQDTKIEDTETNLSFEEWKVGVPLKDNSGVFSVKKMDGTNNTIYAVYSKEVTYACMNDEALIGSVSRYLADRKDPENIYLEGKTPREAFGSSRSSVIIGQYLYQIMSPQSGCADFTTSEGQKINNIQENSTIFFLDLFQNLKTIK